MKSVLIISDKDEAFGTLRSAFAKKDRIAHAQNIENALEILHKRRFDLLFVDIEACLRESHQHGKAIQPFLDLYPTLRIIVMAPRDKTKDALMTVNAGASGYLLYPLQPDEISHVSESVMANHILRSELDYLRDHFWKSDADDVVHTRNRAMQKVFEKIRSVAPTDSTVLLVGETGTGKGVMARLIHRHSRRENAQFISVHCGAVPETLLESELFGHEKGAFTGAIRRKPGKFEIAKSGTIFLDEIGTVPPSAQIKLLQVLQDSIFYRVGGDEPIETDARIIAATNTDLKEMSREGLFRKDLYYRLNIFPIELPPLRDRIEDLPFLLDVLLNKMKAKFRKKFKGVHPDVMEAMRQYSWPGNIRELENLLERACILEDDTVLTPDSFPAEIFEGESGRAVLPVDSDLPLSEARRIAVEAFERQYLKDVLARNRGRVNKSAQEAGISTRQLHKLMLRYDLHKEEFKA